MYGQITLYFGSVAESGDGVSEFHSLSEKCVIVGEDGCAGGGTLGGGDSSDQGDCHQVGGVHDKV